MRKKSGRKKGSKPYNLGKKSDIICNSQSIPIYQYTLNGEFIQKWDCTRLASITLNISRDALWNNLKNKNKSSGGYIWSYNFFKQLNLNDYKHNKPGRKHGSIPWNKRKF